jgi:hypothetical protein
VECGSNGYENNRKTSVRRQEKKWNMYMGRHKIENKKITSCSDIEKIDSDQWTSNSYSLIFTTTTQAKKSAHCKERYPIRSPWICTLMRSTDRSISHNIADTASCPSSPSPLSSSAVSASSNISF